MTCSPSIPSGSPSLPPSYAPPDPGGHRRRSPPSNLAGRPQPPTTDYAPPPPPPQTLHALLDDARGNGFAPSAHCAHCAHRPQTPTTDYAPPPQTAEVRVDAVENDEVIAHALQEELAQVAMAEAKGGASSCSADSVLAQHWIRPEFVSHFPSAPPYVEEQEAGGFREPFSSCSSPEDDNGQGCTIELVEDFSAIDGEVGKRLNDMVPVPHVPKTNGEIPSVDEAFSDHRRLLDRAENLTVRVDMKVQPCYPQYYLVMDGRAAGGALFLDRWW